MLNRRDRAAVVVDDDGGAPGLGRAGVHQQDRHPPGELIGQIGGADVGRQDDHPVHAAAHGADGRQRVLGAVMRAGDDQMLAVRPRGQVHAADQLREELAEQVGQDDADGVVLAGRQAAGAEVRDVAQMLHRIEHALAGRVRCHAQAVQHAGDGRHRHLGAFGHVAHGGGLGERRTLLPDGRRGGRCGHVQSIVSLDSHRAGFLSKFRRYRM